MQKLNGKYWNSCLGGWFNIWVDYLGGKLWGIWLPGSETERVIFETFHSFEEAKIYADDNFCPEWENA